MQLPRGHDRRRDGAGAEQDLSGLDGPDDGTVRHRHQSQHHVLRSDGPSDREVRHQWRHHYGLRPDGSADRNDQREQVTVGENGLLAVQPSLSAGLNNYFRIVWPHHHGLATEKIRQRTRKSVYPVSFVPQIR